VVGVPGHARGVEHDQTRDAALPGDAHHVGGEAVDQALEGAVGVLAQDRGADPERGRGLAQLGLAQRGQVSGDAVDRRRLAMGQAQHGHLGARATERVEDRAEPERLVVGVRHDGEHRRPGRQRVRPGRVRCRGGGHRALLPTTRW
jgi:hypothetical protein